jgi:predicted enzyme related to lactoylglutathione lyase
MTVMTDATDANPQAGPPDSRTGIATFDLVVLDTPDHRGLAEFYSALLGWQVVRVDDDWATIRPEEGAPYGLAFQLAPDHVPPTWPDTTSPGAVPQQFHLDVNVEDVDEAERRVLELGATATGMPGTDENFRVYRDPSGHPFCLCW